MGADVRGEDHNGVAEIDGPSLPVGQATVLEDLQEDVKHVRMRFFHLVEEYHGVRFPPHRLGQRPAFLVSHVSGRRPDHPRDGVLLHVFGHVESHHRRLIVEQELRQGPGQLRLPHPGGAHEQEGPDGAQGVFQSRLGAADGVRNQTYGVFLPHHPLSQPFFHPDEFLDFPLYQPRNRNTGPARHDLGNVLFVHLLLQKAPLRAAGSLCMRFRLPLELRNDAVLELRRPTEVSFPLGPLHLRDGPFDLLLDLAALPDALPFLFPPGPVPGNLFL